MAAPRPSDIWRLGDALDPLEKLVALALVDYGERAFPSQGTLAMKCGLSRRCVQTVLERLRVKGVLTTKSSGKALTYLLNLTGEVRTTCASGCAPRAQEKRTTCASDAHHVRRDPNEPNGTSPSNQEPAQAGTGLGGVPEGTWSRITARDPRAALDIEGQRNVTGRTLASYGIGGADAREAWQLLLEHWGRTGNRPYDVLTQVVTERSLDGVKDVARVVMHRIREAA